MFITLNLASEIPIYLQIRDCIVSAIAQGRLGAGDPLPSVRRLAVDIGVNLHTVNKAYTLLKSDGYLTIDRRSGARVADQLRADEALVARITASIDAAATEAYSRGMTKQSFLTLCESAFDSLKEASI